MDINNVSDFEKFMVCSQGINSIINKIVTENVANTDTNTKDDIELNNKDIIVDCMNKELGDESETRLKTILGAAKIITNGNTNREDPIRIAASVDDAFTKSKLAYLVHKGLMTIEDSLNAQVDRALNRLFAFLENIIDSGVIQDFIINGVINLTALIPELGPVIAPTLETNREIFFVILSGFDNKIKESCKKVIGKLSEVARKSLSYIRQKTERLVESFASYIKKQKQIVNS